MTRTQFQPSGVISLTTDFGHKGPFTGTMKGQILKRFPEARIVDLTHESSVHWPAEAGFWVSHSYPYFPPGTVHVAVVDPGVGTQRDIIAIVHDGHLFLAPDNGLLAPLVDYDADDRVFRLAPTALEKLGIGTPSATFHGRDIFAPVAAELAAGRCQPERLGPVAAEIVPSLLEDPLVSRGRVTGMVITVDHFGNLITNIAEAHISGLEGPVAKVAGHRIGFHTTYGEVEPGQFLALINSFGMVEIACAERSAAESLGLERGAPVVVGAG